MQQDKPVACAECGMPCDLNEYHPYAACLMFKACKNSYTVRENLQAIRAPDDRVRALVEASDKLVEEYVGAITREYEMLRAIQNGLTKGDTRMREIHMQPARKALAALAGVREWM